MRLASQRMSVDMMAFAVAFIVAAFFLPLLNDGDTFWHLGAGRWIVEHLAVPRTDPFSYSNPGLPWHAHEWGAEAAMWLAWKAAGLAGLLALTAFAIAAATALLADEVQRHLAPRTAVLVTAIAFVCLLPSALARPHILALPLFVAWVAALLRARDADRSPPLLLALLMLVWANLHGSFLLGLALIVPLAAEALIAGPDRRRAAIGWIGFGLLAGLAALATPFGLSSFLFPLQVSSMETLGLIQEWRPSTVARDPVFFTLLLGTLAGFFALGVRFSPIRALIWVGLLGLSLAHVRHQFLFAFLGWMFAAGPLAAALPSSFRASPTEQSRADRVANFLLASLVVTAIAVRLFVPADPADRNKLPLGLIERLPHPLRTAPVYNDYSFGGPLVFHGIRPFIDGRADMYGDDFVRAHVRAERGDLAAFDRLRRRYGIRWTLLRPESRLARRLEEAGWRRVLADERAAVHVAPSSAEAPGQR